MQLLLLDPPLAPDKPLWTGQAAYNKQAGCCRQSLSGRAQGRPRVDVSLKKKKKISRPSFMTNYKYLIETSAQTVLIGCASTSFSFFFNLQTWERTLKRNPRVKRWHWTRRCCCAVIPPRECHNLRWGADTGDIYRSVSIYPFLTGRTKCKK